MNLVLPHPRMLLSDPPIGLNLFVISGIAKLPVHEVARGVLPFFVVRMTGLMLITYVPAISLALVR